MKSMPIREAIERDNETFHLPLTNEQLRRIDREVVAVLLKRPQKKVAA